jgi:hypothetical protein
LPSSRGPFSFGSGPRISIFGPLPSSRASLSSSRVPFFRGDRSLLDVKARVLDGKGPWTPVDGPRLSGRGPMLSILGPFLSGRGPMLSILGPFLSGRGRFLFGG